MTYAIVDSKKKVEIQKERFGERKVRVFVSNGSEDKIYIPNLEEVLYISSDGKELGIDFLPPSLNEESLIPTRKPSAYKLISMILNYYHRNEVKDRLYIIPEISSERFMNAIIKATNNNIPIHRTLAEFVYEFENFKRRP